MPELPEVEIICRNLSSRIRPASTITDWQFFRPDLRFKIPKRALHNLLGCPLIEIKRRAKYILFDFGEHILISHLGMTGSWRQVEAGWERKKHDHLAFTISNKAIYVFADPRRFGFIEVIRSAELGSRFIGLGVEPLDKSTDFIKLQAAFKRLNAPIKNALMNQKLLVGVGNIYASEVLFRTGINPLKKCAKITAVQYQTLFKEICIVLREAIEAGGSSISDYRNVDGEKGIFQQFFFVYDRAGETCHRCHSNIKSVLQAGRSTFWCPSCQKKS